MIGDCGKDYRGDYIWGFLGIYIVCVYMVLGEDKKYGRNNVSKGIGKIWYVWEYVSILFNCSRGFVKNSKSRMIGGFI